MKIEESAYIADGAIVLGNVIIGEESSIWFHATVRGDRGEIRIGNGSNIQDNAVVHVDENFPVHIGNYVTVGEIWKNIMKEALPYLNIYPTEEVPADMQEEVAAEHHLNPRGASCRRKQ